jgi:hypothetical protein
MLLPLPVEYIQLVLRLSNLLALDRLIHLTDIVVHLSRLDLDRLYVSSRIVSCGVRTYVP